MHIKIEKNDNNKIRYCDFALPDFSITSKESLVMKKYICLFFIFLLSGCITYDPPRGLLHIFNNSDEAIYVCLQCGESDRLPLSPKLVLFDSISAKMEDAQGNPIEPHLTSPEYRINPYDISSLHIEGTRNRPRLPCDENKVTLFFIAETTMRNKDWESIYKDQLFITKITLTDKELENKNWKYFYNDKK